MRWIVCAGFAALLMLSGAASAQEGGIRLELNKLEQRDGACRAYFVLTNETPQLFERFKLDLVLFSRDGVIADRIAAETGPILPHKTSVKLFDLPRLACKDIARVLVNDVMECGSADAPRDHCVMLIQTASRTSAALVK